MARLRERYGNGPVSWPFSARVALTVAVLAIPAFMLLMIVLTLLAKLAEPTTDVRVSAFYLLLGGMTLVFGWPLLRWTWTPSDEALIREWRVERELREALEREAKGEDGSSLGIHDRETPRRW